MNGYLTTSTRTVAEPTFTAVAHGLLQRCTATAECDESRKKREGTLQRAAVDSSTVNEVPPIVHEVLRSPGQPLDGATRAFMEPRFSRDFSNVRVHTDVKAAESARAVNALAYTVGQDVIFGAGRYAPHTHEGRRLVAHELTHVTQQRGLDNKLSKLSVGAAHDQYEQEADRVTEQVMLGNAVTELPIRCESLVQRTIGDGHDLTAPWLAGDAVLEAIYDNERLMRNGRTGTAVKKIQQLLFYLGIDFPAHGADGIFGSETEAAVKEFQRANVDEAGIQLVDDGIIGPLTMGALNREANRTGTIVEGLTRATPLAALPGPSTARRPPLSVDRIDIIDSAAGAIGGYPAILGNANLNTPGPFNDPTEVKNVHQISFHLDNGSSADLTPLREVRATFTRAGGAVTNMPPDQALPPGTAGPPTPGGFTGVRIANDGPPAHEIQRPTADTLVVADAPGPRGLVPANFPVTLNAHFIFTVNDSRGAPVARINYDVFIDRRSVGDVPNTANRIVSTDRKDFVRGKHL